MDLLLKIGLNKGYVMNRIINKNVLRISVLLLFFLNAFQPCLANEEVPLLPMTVQGTALVDGSPAPEGTVIAAYFQGVQAGKFQVSNSTGKYCLWISGTAADEGKPISFTVGGKNTDKILTWKPGQQVLSLQLSVGKGGNSTDYAKSLTTFIGSGSFTNTENVKVSGKNLETKVIESSVPMPDVDVLKSMSTGSLGKEISSPYVDLVNLKSAPGLIIGSAIAGILLFIFGFCLARKRN